jgi:transposase
MSVRIAVLGIDLGKNSYSIVGLDDTGKGRGSPADAPGQCDEVRLQPESPCVVSMEACRGAHHPGRILRDQGPSGPINVAGIPPAACQDAKK